MSATLTVASVADLATSCEAHGWRVLAEGPGRLVAERAIPNTLHDWHVVICTQLPPSRTWTVTLYHRTPLPPSREAQPYHYRSLGKGEGLTTTAEVGLFVAGLPSTAPHGEAA